MPSYVMQGFLLDIVYFHDISGIVYDKGLASQMLPSALAGENKALIV